jgi:hypothetical protein
MGLSVQRRLIIYLAGTIALLAIGRLLYTTRRTLTQAPPSVSPSSSSSSSSSSASASAAPPATTTKASPLRRPPSSVAELGVLTNGSDKDLRAALDRDDLASRIGPDLCGDENACRAVRSTLLDERATTLQVIPATDWNAGQVDVDASAVNLSAPERASIPKRRLVVVVNVAGATSPDAVALRTAYAAAVVIARRVGGLVHDTLLGRIETAGAFASHAVTASLGDSTFRRDRVELLYEPKGEGVVRVLTAGLSRWGAPDVEAARVPISAADRAGQIVLAIARAFADGSVSGPVIISPGDIAGANDEDARADAGLPPMAPIAVELVSVHAEAGDPNDWLVRIEPPAGDGPMGYLDLAERFFGPLFTALAPPAGVMQKRRTEAQGKLPAALERWSSPHAGDAKLLVQLPFTIPGDAGIESMWIEVTGYDARTVTGKLVDEPLGATNVTQGSNVTRPREDVEDLREPTAQR